jgi:hypothetical protein
MEETESVPLKDPPQPAVQMEMAATRQIMVQGEAAIIAKEVEAARCRPTRPMAETLVVDSAAEAAITVVVVEMRVPVVATRVEVLAVPMVAPGEVVAR